MVRKYLGKIKQVMNITYNYTLLPDKLITDLFKKQFKY